MVEIHMIDGRSTKTVYSIEIIEQLLNSDKQFIKILVPSIDNNRPIESYWINKNNINLITISDDYTKD